MSTGPQRDVNSPGVPGLAWQGVPNRQGPAYEEQVSIQNVQRRAS